MSRYARNDPVCIDGIDKRNAGKSVGNNVGIGAAAICDYQRISSEILTVSERTAQRLLNKAERSGFIVVSGPTKKKKYSLP